MAAPGRMTSKAERTRAAILDAAEELIAERGFEATRLEDVAERVGIRRASIVYYFRDKRELYEAVLRDLFGGLLVAVSAPLDGPGSLAARIEGAVSAWVEYIGRRPSLPRLLLREVLDAHGQTPVLRDQTEPFFELSRRLLAESSDHPLLRDRELDPAHLASAIAGSSVFYLTALPSLVPELGAAVSPERLQVHRDQLLRLVRRLFAPHRLVEKS